VGSGIAQLRIFRAADFEKDTASPNLEVHQYSGMSRAGPRLDSKNASAHTETAHGLCIDRFGYDRLLRPEPHEYPVTVFAGYSSRTLREQGPTEEGVAVDIHAVRGALRQADRSGGLGET
jgi:hypothetical protein